MEYVVFYFPNTHWTERKSNDALTTAYKTMQYSLFSISRSLKSLLWVFGGWGRIFFICLVWLWGFCCLLGGVGYWGSVGFFWWCVFGLGFVWV